MSTTVKDVNVMSDQQVMLYAAKFTEEFLKDEGWTPAARKALYKRSDEIITNIKLSKSMVQCSMRHTCKGHCDHRAPHLPKDGCGQDYYCRSERKKAVCEPIKQTKEKK
jgi:hypothetical protein